MKELIKTLRLGASISRERNMNLDYAIVADKAADAIEKLQAKLDWIDNNTTFHDVDRAYTTEAVNVPVLASVAERIWYHATDDKTSYPFSAMITEAMK